MPLTLYDTLTRSTREIRPEDGKTLRFYCCGPTVYGPAHIGNLRTFLLQDVFRRTVEIGGMRVRHVRNLTDVDDKTIRESRAEGVPLAEFTRRWTDRFHQDSAALNMLPPHVEPAATAHIAGQIDLIQCLIDRGHAYASEGGSVYFRVSSFEAYGKLSRLKEREITTDRAGPGGGEPIDADEYERDSGADFALWKAHKEEDGDVSWDSPWGRGRPGWHLECSAMSMAYLGETFDLHGGGIDLVFPHHENEIAQSEACTCKPLARHWFHCAHLMVEGKKMSKSLGNLYTVDDVQAKGHGPMVLRYALTSAHYRQQLNFTPDSLHAAESALRRLRGKADALIEAAGIDRDAFYDPEAIRAHAPENGGGFRAAWDSLRDDLNTSAALGETFRLLGSRETLPAGAAETKEHVFGFARILYALGLDLHRQEEKTAAPDDVRHLADERWAAKQARDFARADTLRDRLKEAGWNVRDRKDGYDLEAL
jgi:cysteinyl-tRNA synthetase